MKCLVKGEVLLNVWKTATDNEHIMQQYDPHQNADGSTSVNFEPGYKFNFQTTESPEGTVYHLTSPYHPSLPTLYARVTEEKFKKYFEVIDE